MIVHELDQRSDEWFALRCGKVTSSGAAAMLAKGRGGKGEGVVQRDYRVQLALERITGRPQGSDVQTPWMTRGTDLESDGVAAYELETGSLVTSVGFCEHESLAAGASPDGLVSDSEGMIEVKCPKPAIHLAYHRAGVVPKAYQAQCRHHLWITGRAWLDFVSYHPELPLFVTRMLWDDDDIDAHEESVRTFLKTVAEEEAFIREWKAA